MSQTIQILNNLYGLMMDLNYHQADEDVLKELKERSDSFVEDQLSRVKLMRAKYKAAATQNRYTQALEQLRMLKEKGVDELRKLLSPQDQLEFGKLFRKFEEITPEDEASILEDQQLLKLIEKLKDNNSGESKL